ncbi:MAG: hypothetical protein GY949_02280 [Gammaproteobacteria bacterium]|nr:hypothetical protein [Gammaproteobacteria bacterium]
MHSSHHTKDKGDLGVLKAQIDLFEQGFTIFIPLTEHCPFDLVAYKDGEFRRVQVKYRAKDRFGKVDVKFSTSWADKHGTHTSPIDKNEVDLYCVYCPDTDECYYLRPEKFGSNASLRVETPKNGQAKRVNFASDYRRVP